MSEPDLKLGRLLQGGWLLVLVALGIGALLIVAQILVDLYIEVLWFDEVGQTSVFWIRTLSDWALRIVVGGLTAGIAYFNFRLVAGTLGRIRIQRKVGDLEIAEQLPEGYVTAAVALGAIFLGLWFGAAVPAESGLRGLLALLAPGWGMEDPFLGRDVGFYVFVLPFLTASVTYGLVLVFLLLGLCIAGYAGTGALSWSQSQGTLSMGRLPRIHLTGLVGVFLLLLAGRFWLGQHLLLLDGNSAVMGIFGYADAEARLPGYRTLALVTLLASALVIWGGVRNRLVPVASALAAVALAGIVLVQFYPSLIQRFRVEPNELVRETPFIEHNLDFTRLGFALDGLERRPFDFDPGERPGRDEVMDQMAGFPVWTKPTLLTTFREVEARFRYYDFPRVAFDRYTALTGTEPVAISVREIDAARIPDPNWQNLHLRERFIRGMGAVSTSLVRETPDGRPPMILAGIPPEYGDFPFSPPDLRLTRPEVYYGSRAQLHAVVTPGEESFRAPDGGPGRPGVDFPEGIRLESPLRTLALAWRFRDANLLFSGEVTDRSHFAFRRQVTERAHAVAPFLRYMEDPYPVVFQGRIVWILDGFTSTRNFPLSRTQEPQLRRPLSYLRNSVKVTVDGVTGETRFYVMDPEDPLLRAYREVFPDLFLPLDEMPDRLRAHIRYPRELLKLQSRVLLQYHLETASRFHEQQDVWAIPQELGRGARPREYEPEHAYFTLPGDEEPNFHLTTAFVPEGRQNLTAIFAARNDPDRYGELLLLDAPVEDQIRGPRQIEALVEQDPEISQQFSLWRTGGSEVWTGHLHLVPVGRRVYYMEPVFLAAEADAIPELRRFVVSDGERVVMERTLEGALRALEGEPVTTAPDEDAPPAPPPVAVGEWPQEALDLLEEAESRLRAGDWSGFGEALQSLREVLEGVAEGPGPAPDGG